MTNYREILRLSAPGLSQPDIERGRDASKRTVNSVLKAAKRENISWSPDNNQTNSFLQKSYTRLQIGCVPKPLYIGADIL